MADRIMIRIGVDYRKTGSRSGMPRKVPLDRYERVQGINIYRPSELISRKLHTIVGERPRQKARDIYGAAWIVAEHPDLLGKTDAAKLQQWLEKMTPETREGLQNGRIPDFPVTRSHPPASWPSAANSSICRTYRKTAGEESRRRSPVANRWMRP